MNRVSDREWEDPTGRRDLPRYGTKPRSEREKKTSADKVKRAVKRAGPALGIAWK